MGKTLKRIKRSAAASILSVALVGSPLHAEMSESLFELANFGVTMGSFTNSLNQLLHSRSPKEQQQIQQRMEYVERMATMQAYSLESFIAADEALASNQSTFFNFFGSGGDDASIDQVYQSFKQYQSMFSHHVLRAMGQFPMPTYERLYIRWKRMPNTNPRMKELAKQQFMSVFRSYARQFIYTTQAKLKSKRRKFLSALKSVERSGPFAMNDKVRFDKAFWDYQQMFKERTEPRHGDLFIPEFPYNNMLVSNQQPNFVYNQSIYQQAGLNQFGYGANTGMGYQMGTPINMGIGTPINMGNTMGMGNPVSMGANMGIGNSMGINGRYSAVMPSYQADQVVPLGRSAQSQQLSSPYGTFAPSTSPDLDARLLQEIYLKQRQYEQSSSAGDSNAVDAAYGDYMQLRDKWFSQ